jgi:hypothetical protein
VTPEELLFAAVRQAINDAEGAAGTPDHLLDLQTAAALGAMRRLGWVKAAGWEYAVMDRDVTAEIGFNTESQARAWLVEHPGPFMVERRPVGVWEPLS